jgi:hypothetical protein
VTATTIVRPSDRQTSLRQGTGTLSRPASASVTHLHSEIAGLSAEIARDALLARGRAMSRRGTSVTVPMHCDRLAVDAPVIASREKQ